MLYLAHVQQATGSPRMGTQQWHDVTSQAQALRIVAKLLLHWDGAFLRVADITPAAGLYEIATDVPIPAAEHAFDTDEDTYLVEDTLAGIRFTLLDG